MWEIYTLVILAIVNFVIAILNSLAALRFNNLLNLIVGVFCTFVCLYLASVTVDIYDSRMTEGKEKAEIENYYKIKNKIEEIKTSESIQNKTELLFYIYPKVEEVNDIIMKNKKHYDSKWDGFEYSEKIGNLKILEL